MKHKKLLSIFVAVSILVANYFALTGCTGQAQSNIMGGQGELKVCSSCNLNLGQAFEDDLYYYYNGYKWAKNAQTTQAVSVCEKIGCDHMNDDCLLNRYGKRLRFGNQVIYWFDQHKLYTISSDGETSLVADLAKSPDGEPLPKDEIITGVTVLNSDWLYIHMPNESGLYCLSSKQFIPMTAYYLVSNETSLFYLDLDQNIHQYRYADGSDQKLDDARAYTLVLDGNELWYGDGHTVFCYHCDSGITEPQYLLPDVSCNEMVFFAEGDYLLFSANDYDPIKQDATFWKSYRKQNNALDELPDEINLELAVLFTDGRIAWIDYELDNPTPAAIHLYHFDDKTQTDIQVMQ